MSYKGQCRRSSDHEETTRQVSQERAEEIEGRIGSKIVNQKVVKSKRMQ